jgi:hypothetical protein
MVREDKSSWKANYFLKIVQLLDEYPKCFLVSIKENLNLRVYSYRPVRLSKLPVDRGRLSKPRMKSLVLTA